MSATESTPEAEASTDLAAATAEETKRADVANEQALRTLGEVVSRPMVTAGGEVLTQADRAAELRARAVQGHAYQK